MPKLDIDLLEKRAELLTRIRSFFLQSRALEIEAPLISATTVTDVHIESVPVAVEMHGSITQNYLITSPEFFMKRLLAAGSPSIYFLGKVFRQGEHGRRHHHEFTMLEWYRLGWNEHQLMNEVTELLKLFLPDLPVKKVTYGELFFSVLGVNPYRAELSELKKQVSRHIDIDTSLLTITDCLDLLFSHCVEPGLNGVVFVYNYPVVQAALAKLACDEHGDQVARRFEVFIDGLELANGYFELTQSAEQHGRFTQDLEVRQKQQKKLYPVDEKLLEALERGLPECAGVALGVDRLLMIMLDKKAIQEVIPLFFD